MQSHFIQQIVYMPEEIQLLLYFDYSGCKQKRRAGNTSPFSKSLLATSDHHKRADTFPREPQ